MVTSEVNAEGCKEEHNKRSIFSDPSNDEVTGMVKYVMRCRAKELKAQL